MPSYVSPGVYVIEKDFSQYAPSVNSSVVGLVGFASKGPTNKATLITSPNRLIDTFGLPNEGITGQALEGALEVLETTNSTYFIRAAGSSAADASAMIDFGSCPAVAVSSAYIGTVSAGETHGTSYMFRIQVADNAGNSKLTAPKEYTVPATTWTADSNASSQGPALRKIIGGSLQTGHVGVHFDSTTNASGFIVGAYAGSGAFISVSAYSGTVGFTPAESNGAFILAAVNPASGTVSGGGDGVTAASQKLHASSLTVYGSQYGSASATSGVGYSVESLYPGAGYNLGTKANGDTSGNSITINNFNGEYFDVVVNEDGVAQETFRVSLVQYKSFIEANTNRGMINTGETNLKSGVIKGNILASGTNIAVSELSNFVNQLSSIGAQGTHLELTYKVPDTGATETQVHAGIGAGGTLGGGRFVKAIEGTYGLLGGDNGVGTTSENATALIGDAAGATKTGMQALDDDVLNVSLAAVPGISTESVQNALITLAETSQNFMAVVAPPYAVGSVQDAIDWTNGLSTSRTGSINNTYAAIYWPWVKVFSVHDGIDRWLDPTIFALRQMAYTDNVSDPWFAPAGYLRGRLTKPSDVEVKLNQGDRDSMYSGGNVVNPIVNFVQQGITIFGQRTATRNPSALDRVNIRRLMIFLRKVILQATRQFVFEPNDQILWEQVEQVLNPFLDDIKRRRGITEFRVVCDESTNTSARIDRNELWCKVLLKPTKAAEILIFEINLTNQSAQLGG
jgi:phage tail sheath protein FI